MNANVPILNEFAGRNTEEVIRMLNETIRQQQAEIEALGDMLIEEGIGVCQKYIDERIAELGKAQEK